MRAGREARAHLTVLEIDSSVGIIRFMDWSSLPISLELSRVRWDARKIAFTARLGPMKVRIARAGSTVRVEVELDWDPPLGWVFERRAIDRLEAVVLGLRSFDECRFSPALTPLHLARRG